MALIAVVAPWGLRNYRALHIISPVRDGFWLEAYAGNNGDTFTSNAAWAHPASNPVEMQRYEALGEVAYMAQKKQLTPNWIESHPLSFAAVTLRRLVRFWTGFWSLNHAYRHLEPLDIPDTLFCTFLTAMMLRGLYRWWQQDRRKTLSYIAVLFLFPLPYYLTHGSPDYREPIEPEIMALVTIGHLWNTRLADRPRIRRRSDRRGIRHRQRYRHRRSLCLSPFYFPSISTSFNTVRQFRAVLTVFSFESK